MTADIVHADNPALARHARKTTPAAALAALGIVYGDLGTSPLYTLQAVLTATGGHFSPEAALGSLSLIFWALIITISIKYCLFVMRADNHGEGGILALMSMTGANWSEGRRILIVMGLFGAALIYGDGIITPAISVLSALEGLNVATDVFKPQVVSIAVAILFALFVIQSRGTAQIAKAFGPVMLLNYAGQVALYLGDPAMDGNPFFRLAPSWSIYPLVGLATIATIIASQAIITGSFSLTRQAMQLGWFPGVRIRQTSSEEYGQIYVPFVNWTMMVLTVVLTVSFGSSDRLAGAYLVEGLGHCGACHTATNELGAPKAGETLKGGDFSEHWYAP